jgi:hypothetical protein
MDNAPHAVNASVTAAAQQVVRYAEARFNVFTPSLAAPWLPGTSLERAQYT